MKVITITLVVEVIESMPHRRVNKILAADPLLMYFLKSLFFLFLWSLNTFSNHGGQAL